MYKHTFYYFLGNKKYPEIYILPKYLQPCIVDTLDGLYIMKVGAGPAHTLYIARNSTEKEKEILAKLPVLDQAHLED